MNTVDISFKGPVAENLCDVTVSDEYASETFSLDHADVEAGKAAGPEALLGLVLENIGSGYDILQAAHQNGSPVILDGENLDAEILRQAIEPGASSPTP